MQVTASQLDKNIRIYRTWSLYFIHMKPLLSLLLIDTDSLHILHLLHDVLH